MKNAQYVVSNLVNTIILTTFSKYGIILGDLMGSKISNLDNCRIEIRTQSPIQKTEWYRYCRLHDISLSELVRIAVTEFIDPPDDVKTNSELRHMVLLLRDKLSKFKKAKQDIKLALKGLED